MFVVLIRAVMTTFNEHNFEKRLLGLKDSQESIQSLSAWCLQHRQHHKKIVAIWLRVLKKVKIEQRLTLFYLANDVIQYSKRKNYEFVASWGTALQRATTMVREDKVKNRILRIFKIWDDRGVYDEAFISDLSGLLSTNTKKTSTSELVAADPGEFQPNVMFDKLRNILRMETDTDLKLKIVNDNRLTLTDVDALRGLLKDKRQADDMLGELDEGIKKMQSYLKALEKEIKERKALATLMNQAKVFYENQQGEAKIVSNAYRNFANGVKTLKRKLDELKPTLKVASPVPSPDVNAPSPSPDSDIELPEEEHQQDPLLEPEPQKPAEVTMGGEMFCFAAGVPPPVISTQSNESLENCYSSFMGNSSFPFDIQKGLFNDGTSVETAVSPLPVVTEDNTVTLPGLSPHEGKPIEVINSRPKKDEGFSIADFLKSLVPGATPCTGIPGLGMDSPPPPETLSPSLPTSLPTNVGADASEVVQYNYVTPASPSPLEPPPIPPPLFESTISFKNDDAWNTKLPPKFPTWGDTRPGWEDDSADKPDEWMPALPLIKSEPPRELDTPESPPMYEKEGFSDPVEYDDSAGGTDVDHRTLVPVRPIPEIDTDHRTLHPVQDVDHRRKNDIDHRNLISLTGSPPVRDNWLQGDRDYRKVPPRPLPVPAPVPPPVLAPDRDYRKPPPTLPRPRDETQDNVESVDMEMSDDEETTTCNFPNLHHPPPNTHSKVKPMNNKLSEDEARTRGQTIPTIGSNNSHVPRPRGPGLPSLRMGNPDPRSFRVNMLVPPPLPPTLTERFLLKPVPTNSPVQLPSVLAEGTRHSPIINVSAPDIIKMSSPGIKQAGNIGLSDNNSATHRPVMENDSSTNGQLELVETTVDVNISKAVDMSPIEEHKWLSPPKLSEAWISDDNLEFDQLESGQQQSQPPWAARGRGGFVAPRGGFSPRIRPSWMGPRRGGPPHFPFRPPHDENFTFRPPHGDTFLFRPPQDESFGRGQRGGFRPFRGNPRHFTGW